VKEKSGKEEKSEINEKSEKIKEQS